MTSIDHYRQEKEASDAARAELEEKLAQLQQQHADYVYETEKKRAIEMHKYTLNRCLVTCYLVALAQW